MNKTQFQILFCSLLSLLAISSAQAEDSFNHEFFAKEERWDDVTKPVNAEDPCSMPLIEDPNPTPGEFKASRKKRHKLPKGRVEKAVNPVELKAPLAESDRIIPPGETLAEIITEQTKLNPLFIPKRSIARKVYDYRDHIPEKFYRDKKPTKENTHIPQVRYQREFSSLLFTAIEKKDIGAISTLLDRGADINAKTLDTGFTPLMTAAWYSNDQAASYLIVKGADLNKQNSIGQTALHIAVIREDINLITLLLRAGAQWNILDNSGKKAVEYAFPNLRDRIFLAIAELSPDKNHTLLEMVCTDSLAAVKYLIEHGANIEVRNVNHETPLIIATKHNNVGIVNLLLSFGAQTGVYDAQGETPLSIAKCKNNQAMVNIIETVAIKRELDSGMGSRPKENPVVELIKADPVVQVQRKDLAPVQIIQPMTTAQSLKVQVVTPAPTMDTGANLVPSLGFFQSIARLFHDEKPDTLAIEPNIVVNKLPVIESHPTITPLDSATQKAGTETQTLSQSLLQRISDAPQTGALHVNDLQKARVLKKPEDSPETTQPLAKEPVLQAADALSDSTMQTTTEAQQQTPPASIPEPKLLDIKAQHGDKPVTAQTTETQQQTPPTQIPETKLPDIKAQHNDDKPVIAQTTETQPQTPPAQIPEAKLPDIKAQHNDDKPVIAQTTEIKPETKLELTNNKEVSEIETSAPKAISKPKSIIPEGLHE